MKKLKRQVFILAFCIALFPPIWAVLALFIMNYLPFNKDINLFITLFILGGLGVIISALLERWIFCPALLCGWAIGLTILAPAGYGKLGTLPVQIGAAMLVGVWYVGVGVNKIQIEIEKCLGGKNKK